MSKGRPTWKIAITVVSILLTVFVWTRGLQESFSRPSVNPKLSLHQREISILAEPAFPREFQGSLITGEPVNDLRNSLRKIPLEEISERNRILLAALETSQENRKLLLDFSYKNNLFIEIKSALLKSSVNQASFIPKLVQSDLINSDPLLYRVSCSALGGGDDICLDMNLANTMAVRLLISQLFPFIAVIIGSILLIRQLWIVFRNKSFNWPPVIALPLTLIDMTILIAGGFVVLGEILVPAIVLPLSIPLLQNIGQPIGDSLKVLIGYSAMSLPPLVILSRQIKGLKNFERPDNGWLQWRIKPINTAILKAINGWLMVLPLVLLVGWLMTSLIGDQGGSNPLLELVLNSKDPIALSLLIFTTVIFAPFFEELIFRGALLPVLAKNFGALWGVVVSGLVFAIAHLSVGEFPPLFVLGLGLGVLRLSSGRLLPCIFMHSIWNGITFFSLLLLGG